MKKWQEKKSPLSMNPLKPVLQEDLTGCGLACVAILSRNPYQTVKAAAERLGIRVTDDRLWSDTTFVRTLLSHFGVPASPHISVFRSWSALPPLALLAIKWHQKKGRAFWHWVVYWRSPSGPTILDPKPSLTYHLRTDFGRIKPKWFISIQEALSQKP